MYVERAGPVIYGLDGIAVNNGQERRCGYRDDAPADARRSDFIANSPHLRRVIFRPEEMKPRSHHGSALHVLLRRECLASVVWAR